MELKTSGNHQILFPKKGEVHLWKAFPFIKQNVTTSGWSFPKRRNSSKITNGVYTPSRQVVAVIASEYLGCSTDDISLGISEGGKPYISGEERLYFNLSHCGDELAIAFACESVGFDMERSDRKGDFVGLARRFYSSSEAADVEKTGGALFLRLWTAKEAMLKLDGNGLQGGLANAEVVSPGVGRIGGRRVCLRELDWPGYHAHVAVFGEVCEVREIDFREWLEAGRCFPAKRGGDLSERLPGMD